MDAGGTTPWMGEVESRREQRSRATHDYRDIGGRVTPGRLQGCKRLKSYGTGFPAVTEEAKAEGTEITEYEIAFLRYVLCALCGNKN